MKYRLLLLLLISIPVIAFSQTLAERASVEVTAEAIETPFAQIKLSWKDDLFATRWNVYRQNDTGVYELLQTVQSPATSFIDDRVTAGKSYTYLIHKEDVTNILGFSQITAGVRTKAAHSSGKCLLIIEDSVTLLLPTEVARLQQDLIHEGWDIQTIGAHSSLDHFAIKDSIKKSYSTDSSITTVLLLGNIAVPYSGYMAPDGHDPITSPNEDHLGAWACDLYYADLDGNWTDVTVKSTNNPQRNINKNLPGDGKFDQNTLPSDADLQVGRIYLEKLSKYETDRMVLYKRHLDRNHNFRTSAFKYRQRSIINDYFVGLNEGFAGFGYRSFPSIAGPDSVQQGALLDYARDSSFLMSYGCGGGAYSKVGVKLRNKQGLRIDSFSVGQTSDFFDYEINSGFNVLFGSYFGDWDSKDNVMRATLAGKSPALASFWAGRPTWHINEFLHGAPLGTSTINSQNSDIELFTYIELNGWTYERMVHPALMGDPTLRIRYSLGMEALAATANKDSNQVRLQWKSDPTAYSGYFIYRKNPKTKAFELINQAPITADTLWDSLPNAGTNDYMVRGLSLHEGYTGSYEMLSPGASATISGIVKLTTSQQGTSEAPKFTSYPNPANDRLQIWSPMPSSGSYKVLGANGTELLTGLLNPNQNETKVNISSLSQGVYFLEINALGHLSLQRIVVL